MGEGAQAGCPRGAAHGRVPTAASRCDSHPASSAPPAGPVIPQPTWYIRAKHACKKVVHPNTTMQNLTEASKSAQSPQSTKQRKFFYKANDGTAYRFSSAIIQRNHDTTRIYGCICHLCQGFQCLVHIVAEPWHSVNKNVQHLGCLQPNKAAKLS